MSIADLKKVVDGSNRQERVFLAAYLRHVNRRDDPNHRKKLDDLCGEFESGQRFSLKRAGELSDDLEKGDR